MIFQYEKRVLCDGKNEGLICDLILTGRNDDVDESSHHTVILLSIIIPLVDCDQDTCDTLYILAMTFLSRWFYRNLA
ncbi:hypothetical protein DERF_009893 [Dermatophagoides farinae]|uniref:Uncharacterized protein n=1 Tax=Dermatophagoides farinae TaxID=6954 RepID=A0A922L2Z8_DERFA|nr:hypothetical protein DERF_009893 [Dermatophagoides farinae]